MEFFDAHCHLQDKRVLADIDAIVHQWHHIGGRWLACCGTCHNDWEAVAALSDRYCHVIPSFGIHPWFAGTATTGWAEKLENRLDSRQSGVGEIGLDLKADNLDLQTLLFKKQLEMAKEKGLPVSIHVRKAWDPFIHILKRTGKLPAGGLIHSYSGSADMIPLFERHGLFISFSGAITNPGNKKAARAIQAVSLDRILMETDTPDILPRIHGLSNSSVNKPENLFYIARSAAATRGISTERLARLTYGNAEKLFHPVMPAPA
ncbi:MAG: TatD family hydrolase [Desulfobacteraceae bacterium]